MPPLIRDWRPADTPAVVHVIKTVYDEYGWPWEEGGYHADLYDIQEHYLDNGGRFFVAELEGEVVGTAALEVFSALPGEPFETVLVHGRIRASAADCSIERMYVLPQARRMGVGSALLKAVLAEAQRYGCASMEIWSDKRLEDAHRLYERFGAKTIGERLCHDPDQSPEWGMLLKLKEPAAVAAGSKHSVEREA